MEKARKAAAKPAGPESGDSGSVLGVRITHPDRVLFADQGVRKIDLADYVARVADRMMPFVANRPLSLVRCPQGAGKTCFFQKHASDGFPEQIRTVEIVEKSGRPDSYLYVSGAEGLVAAVQMGTLEFHVWGATIEKLETPDRMIFDLDPDEGLAFDKVKQAATSIRELLSGFGLDSVPMVTGGKGIHVVVPLQPRADWDDVKRFAKALALRIAADDPDAFTATMAKAKRRDRIFIDWLRNERGATAIAPYSPRARVGAPIATPVSWEELQRLDRANGFLIEDVAKRLGEADPWKEAGTWRQALAKTMLAAAEGN